MKVTGEDTESYGEVNGARRVPGNLRHLVTAWRKKGGGRDRRERVRVAPRPPRSIKASASAENFYMNGFHYVADLLRASSRALISPSQRVLLSSATIQPAARRQARYYFSIGEARGHLKSVKL